MKKKVLIIGNSANSYALAKKMSENNEVFVAPMSDSIQEFATCLDIREDNVSELLEFVLENDIDMTIAISAKAIDADIAAIFNNNKQQIFAPCAKANEIITNKAFAKKTLYKLRIPTPKFAIFEKINLVNDYIKNQKIPYVIKTNDNNSASIITSAGVAKNIADAIFMEKNKKIIIEDYIYGTSFSFYTLTDGYKALPLGNSVIYKHSLDGDGGQLTSGMGACIPNYKLSISDECFLMKNVIYPTLEYLETSGNTYIGILGVNGIISDDGKIYILGWQSFTQDVDTDAILNNIDDDLYTLFESCVIGSFSDEFEHININDKSSVSIVLTCKNKDNNENIIKGLDKLDDNTILSFFPSVKKNRYAEFEANTGQVLVLTCSASSLSKASEKAYNEVKDIDFSGKYYRNDISKINNFA